MDFSHWEDFQKEKLEIVPDLSADIELSMNKLFLKELEEGEDHSVKTENIVVPPLNPMVLHAISLHKHTNYVIEMIKLNENKKNLDKIDFKIPKYEETREKYPNLLQNLNFTVADFHNFSEENPPNVAELSKTIVRQIMTKSIATLFAHLGYENGQQSALDLLTDVLEEFFRKICHQTKVAIDDENSQYCGFPHVIERVLTEMGLGGVKTLNDYYQSRVIKYLTVLENRCRDFHDQYHALAIPKLPPPVDEFNKVVRVKVEEEDVIEVENQPEVHFSTIDGDYNLSILETGYQLLNSLEAETNFHSMPDEDITESPGIVSLSSDEMSHLSPFNKKKRFK